MADGVYERLRTAIISGEWESGAQLPELTLAEHYGVSRTPIREALRRLEQDGLVERADRGMRVRGRSPEEILEIYEVRIVLEGAVASAAAKRRTEIDLIRLRRAAEAMAEVDSTDAYAMATANRAFHETMWQASHNRTLIDLLTRLNDHLARYPATTLTRSGRWESALAEHGAILAAIENQRPEEAAECAERHMAAARDIRLDMYAAELR
ncbi:DNA-binding GntR family transcriptional regulator [Lipingzhangella halophila]|uniref:DNA-binding GntR family transcriptional regulator n=1 Tax=Lipingzhangella halophila TaxID=1783352 RepID=A0A7W7RJA0_9ACTN|nr:GntR family transcriptional regulator [Lipingzhangella halophila]MBB4933033.1 DNA-binding GntR family transcriptional regulator [Lipingzhangella halophila]